MAFYELKPTSHKGQRLFATRYIKAGEFICRVDMTAMKKYSLQEFDSNPDLDSDHSDYVGNEKYAIDYSPGSYVNHSCEPNCYFKMYCIFLKDRHAARDIRTDEELTHDYAATSIDQFAGNSTWVLDCRCGNAGCRRKVKGDFFELPLELQRRYYAYLPVSIKRKYREQFRQLFGKS
jgi:SET domain-containing protein